MEIKFDREEFRRTLKEQLDYVLKHESNELLEDVINELVHQRLLEMTEEDLNTIAEDDSYISPSTLKESLSRISLEVSSIDINHRYLVREMLKKHLCSVLYEVIRKELR